ncbi:MAG: dihydrofolate reductase family protein [Terracoccus sp.]
MEETLGGVTSTLTGDLGWNSTAIEGDPVAYVRELQQQGEGNIAVTGGIETVRSLFVAGLVDALTLTVHPVVTDEGRRLFDESVPMTRLSLLSGTTTGAGNAILTYALRP